MITGRITLYFQYSVLSILLLLIENFKFKIQKSKLITLS